MSALISRPYPLKSFRTVRQKTARVHLSMRCVHFASGAVCRRAKAGKLDAAIAANLKELGYGG
ncbi:MAG: hypothetical protein KA072_05235 [Thermoanaerobaculaceae bacterium]|nr:hypothetical protein [Thermoanaerobaculaceae bacterium]